MTRSFDRSADQLRPIRFDLDIAPHANASVLCSFGNTRVICAVMIEDRVPPWMMKQQVKGGWVTAEYSMLPYSTLDRKQRDVSKGKQDGRGVEIQRLIGRSLRAVIDLEKLGQRTLWVDCDVLQADGGTRTASITGSSLAIAIACQRLVDAGKLKQSPIKGLIAAVSAGIVEGEAVLDLDYLEDKDAAVDFNFVLTEALEFVEVQGAGEEATFTQDQFDKMVALGKIGAAELIRLQHAALAAVPSSAVTSAQPTFNNPFQQL